jgi:ubiquinone/menaquinone biosynthesis C-methylase UbiE
MAQDIGEFFAQYTRAYYEVLRHLPGYKILSDLHFNALSGAKRVLDSGCGPDDLVGRLLEEDSEREVTAVDKNEEALVMLRRNASKYGSRLITLNSDFLNMDLPDEYFDGINSKLVIDFVDDWKQYIAEHARVLAPGGVIVISGPDERTREYAPELVDRWKQELMRLPNWEEIEEYWNLFIPYTQDMPKTKVKNWLNVREIYDELTKHGIPSERIDNNPLYHTEGGGYLVQARKN